MSDTAKAAPPSFALLTETDYGLMLCHCFDETQTGALVGTGKALAHHDIEVIAGYLRTRGPESVFVDVGAHIGIYSFALRPLCARVIAFEAQRLLYNLLCGSIAINGWTNVFAQNVCVGDKFTRTEQPQFDPWQSLNWGSVEFGPEQREPIGQERQHDPARVEYVPVVPLDSYELERVDVLKIDVEGMEAAVIRGARLTIARCRPILVVEHIKSDLDELNSLIQDMGYSIRQTSMDLICEPVGHLGLASLVSNFEPPLLSAYTETVKPGSPETISLVMPTKVERPNPTNPVGKLMHDAFALVDAGNRDASNVQVMKVLAHDRDHIDAHILLGQNLLALGEWRAGWEELLWVNLREPARSQVPALHLPIWNGMALRGSLLVIADQGVGDSFMYARFLPEASRSVLDMDFRCFPGTEDIMRGIACVDTRILSAVDEEARYTAYCRLSSLPYILGVTERTIPPNAYIDPNRARGTHGNFRPPIPPSDQLRIGVAWRGNPQHANDDRRSFPVNYLTSLIDLPGLTERHPPTWYALQPGMADEIAAARLPIDPLKDRAGTWLETMELILCMDLVITVDTAVAHLAGAMGKLTWLLLPTPCDWRWQEQIADSVWYPRNFRLFRQPSPGNWPAVICNLKDALSRSRLQQSR